MIKFNTYARFHEFLSWSSQQLILSSNFEDGIPPWLDSSYLTHDPVTGTVNSNPSFYSPTVESGNLTVGRVYEIMAQSVEDFTADGAAANTVGTIFVASGTSVTLSAVDSVRELSLDATNLISNGSFEVAGAGGADVFAGWVESFGSGDITDEVADVNYGSHASKLTAGFPVDTQILAVASVVSGYEYCLQFMVHGDGSYAGRYYVWDNTHSSSIIATVSTNIITTSYTKYSVIFEIPSGCSAISVALRCPSTEGGIAYFDDVSLRRVLPGKELLADPDGDAAGTWTAGSGGSVSDGVLAWDGSQAAASEIYEAALTANDLISYGFSIDSRSSGSVSALYGAAGVAKSATGNYSGFGVAGATHGGAIADADFVGSVGYVNLRKFTLSTATSTLRLPGAKRVKAGVTAAGSEWAGVVMGLDSQTSPANFVVAFIDAGDTDDFKVYKVVAGVWTSLIDTNVTYVAGAEVEIRRSGDTFSFYYNGSQVGSSATVTGMTGAYCGLFATGNQSVFSNIECL